MPNNIEVGMFVKWNHKVRSNSGFKDFIAKGKILNIKKSRVGGTNNIVDVACIQLIPNGYWRSIKRKNTTVSLSKLTLINYIYPKTIKEIMEESDKLFWKDSDKEVVKLVIPSEVKDLLQSSLISLLEEVEKRLPWPSSDGDTEWANGYDKYRSEVVELLSNLKKEICDTK